MRTAIWLGVGAMLAGCSDPTGPETPIVGEQLYNQYCARCHGLEGRGVPNEAGVVEARLDDPRAMTAKTDEHIMGVIRMGQPPKMPGFAEEFTDAKIMVLAAYVLSLTRKAVAEGEADLVPAE